ncbi:MAG: signal peptidase I [Lachnospiraceae bacterium]|nr:signal peptidase I [Lachnospiraceae bacterium]
MKQDDKLNQPIGSVEESAANEQEEKEPKKGILATIWEYVVTIGVAVIAALLINNFILLNANIPSGSMENTIMEGDRVFGFRLAYLFSEPERGDIVIFKWPDDESVNYIKRVIGLPGETVTIRNGVVYIDSNDGNGEWVLDEPYLKETPWERDYGPYEVPEDSYFMLGDNRNNSKDSRLWENTFVHKDKILAKAFLKYWKGFELY